MSMEQNQLTRDLYAAGYTREDHPSFVYWSDWQNFGYLFEALLKFTWETPCGQQHAALGAGDCRVEEVPRQKHIMGSQQRNNDRIIL